jgi:hypothetical protein
MAAQYLDIGLDSESNPEHDNLIAHLRGVRHVVINSEHGGFSISRVAELAYLERTGTPHTFQDREDRAATLSKGQYIMVNDQYWDGRTIKRDDPVLVDIVREMREAANGDFASLRVVELPADVDWIIEEYDGQEWVAERHRTWS